MSDFTDKHTFCSSTANQYTIIPVLLKLFGFSFHVVLLYQSSTAILELRNSLFLVYLGMSVCLQSYFIVWVFGFFPIWKENLHQIHQEAIWADRSCASTSFIAQASRRQPTPSSSFMHKHFLIICFYKTYFSDTTTGQRSQAWGEIFWGLLCRATSWVQTLWWIPSRSAYSMILWPFFFLSQRGKISMTWLPKSKAQL